MTLADCSPSFQATIQQAAEKYGQTTEFVYGLWRKYCDLCRDYDQSAIWFEFVNWFEPQLKG